MNPTTPTPSATTFSIRITGDTPASIRNAADRWADLVDYEIICAGAEVTEVIPTEGFLHGPTDIVISAPLSAAIICDRVGIVGPHVDRQNGTVSRIDWIRN